MVTTFIDKFPCCACFSCYETDLFNASLFPLFVRMYFLSSQLDLPTIIYFPHLAVDPALHIFRLPWIHPVCKTIGKLPDVFGENLHSKPVQNVTTRLSPGWRCSAVEDLRRDKLLYKNHHRVALVKFHKKPHFSIKKKPTFGNRRTGTKFRTVLSPHFCIICQKNGIVIVNQK